MDDKLKFNKAITYFDSYKATHNPETKYFYIRGDVDNYEGGFIRIKNNLFEDIFMHIYTDGIFFEQNGETLFFIGNDNIKECVDYTASLDEGEKRERVYGLADLHAHNSDLTQLSSSLKFNNATMDIYLKYANLILDDISTEDTLVYLRDYFMEMGDMISIDHKKEIDIDEE